MPCLPHSILVEAVGSPGSHPHDRSARDIDAPRVCGSDRSGDGFEVVGHVLTCFDMHLIVRKRKGFQPFLILLLLQVVDEAPDLITDCLD
jgi:hypothetical protein